MNRLLLLALAAVGLSLSACGADAPDDKPPRSKPSPSKDDKGQRPDSPSATGMGPTGSRPSADIDRREPRPGEEHEDPEPEEPEPEVEPDPSPDPPSPPDPNPPSGERSASCTSESGSNSSVTAVKYKLSGGKAVVREMVVQVTNADGRDKNDVDVFVTDPNAAEVFSFNSGDILASGKATKVPLPSGFQVKSGGTVRVETNFDRWGFDPSASCVLKL